MALSSLLFVSDTTVLTQDESLSGTAKMIDLFTDASDPKKVKRNVVVCHFVPLHMFSPILIYFHWYLSLIFDHTSLIPGEGPAWAAWAAWAVPNNRLSRKTIYIIVFGLSGYIRRFSSLLTTVYSIQVTNMMGLIHADPAKTEHFTCIWFQLIGRWAQ